MSNSEQNPEELKNQGNLDNSNNNNNTTIQNISEISAIEKDKKGGLFPQEQIINILKQNQPDDVKKNELAVSIRNVPQKEEKQIQKVSNANKIENFNSGTDMTNNSNSNKSSRKCSCPSCCDNCDCKCGTCSMILLAIFIFIVNIIAIALLSKVNSWTEKDPLKDLTFESDLWDVLEEKTETLSATISSEEIRYQEAKNTNLLRYLSVNCDNYNSKLEANNYKLNKVFKLNFDKVHNMAKGMETIIIICFVLLYLILLTVFCGESCLPICAILTIISFFVIIISSIINFIFFIIMIINYFKGNGTGEFLDYYKGCLDIGKRLLLSDANEKLNKLNKVFIAFLIFYIISMILNLLYNFLLCKQFK